MSELSFVGYLIVIGLALTCNNYFTYNYVYVEIDKRILRGFNTTSWRGIPYCSFKDIPYAKPPLGELRFKVDIVFCVYRGQEDCLFLNVYTTSMKADRMATMVWMYGGIFMLGSGNDELYGSDYFMEAGVVLVTINYRLGALAFLSTGEDGAPGSVGLKDQVAVLRWVRRNIAKFGGDPDNVTIFGESSGATYVQYHLLSALSAGLFSRGIALNTWAISENGPDLMVRLAESLGAKDIGGDAVEALKFLKDTPTEDIVRMQTAIMTPEEVRTRIPFLFFPSVGKNVHSGEVFMTNRPLDILKSGNFNSIPYMTGYTSHEGYFFVDEITDPKWLEAATEDTERFVPLDIKNEVFCKELAKSVCTFYFNNTPIAIQNISNYVDVFSYSGMNNILKSFFDVRMPGG